MQKKLKRNSIKLIGWVSCLIVLTFIMSACDPGGNITIRNLENQEMTIFFTHVRADGSLDNPSKQGTIPPVTAKRFGIVFLGSEWIERIEAIDPSGKIVFSHDYKMADLEKVNWEITISP
jgi:hypothetical protein